MPSMCSATHALGILFIVCYVLMLQQGLGANRDSDTSDLTNAIVKCVWKPTCRKPCALNCADCAAHCTLQAAMRANRDTMILVERSQTVLKYYKYPNP